MSQRQPLYAISDRVVIPPALCGAIDVRGVIVGLHPHLGREPNYDLQWQSTDAVDDNFNLLTVCANGVTESELQAAQQKPKAAPTRKRISPAKAKRYARNIGR